MESAALSSLEPKKEITEKNNYDILLHKVTDKAAAAADEDK